MFVPVQPLYYNSPETLKEYDAKSNNKIDSSADIYSFGVLLYEIIHGQVPFADISDNIGKAALLKRPPLIKDFNQYLDMRLIRLIESMMSYERDLRPTFEDICTNPWVVGMNSGNEFKLENYIAESANNKYNLYLNSEKSSTRTSYRNSFYSMERETLDSNKFGMYGAYGFTNNGQ